MKRCRHCKKRFTPDPPQREVCSPKCVKLRARKYSTEYMRERLKASKHRNRTRELERARRSVERAANRPKWNADRKDWITAKRKRDRKRLGLVCGFLDCGATNKLHIHHDHARQARQQCCKSPCGCEHCQVCLLCPKHNHMLGILSDDVLVARQVVEFLERFHEPANQKISRFIWPALPLPRRNRPAV
jgi:hypothetical protein